MDFALFLLCIFIVWTTCKVESTEFMAIQPGSVQTEELGLYKHLMGINYYKCGGNLRATDKSQQGNLRPGQLW